MGTIPIVPSAVIFDLGNAGKPLGWPSADDAYQACDNATADYADGRVGVGRGATCGKAAGIEKMVPAGIGSWATRFGVRGVFAGARILHALTVAALVVAGLGLSVGWFYWLGVAVVVALLAYEHLLVRPNDLRRLDAAFFTMNGVISIAFFVFVLFDAA